MSAYLYTQYALKENSEVEGFNCVVTSGKNIRGKITQSGIEYRKTCPQLSIGPRASNVRHLIRTYVHIWRYVRIYI